MKLIQATEKKSPLKLGLGGMSGSGKTYTSLVLATEFADEKPIVVIDSEKGSSARYSREFDFLVCELENFSPHSYLEAIKLAATANPGVVIIDSLSHLWFWELDKASASKSSFTGWKDIRPQEREVFEAIASINCTTIVTCRTTDNYEMEVNSKGKSAPVLKGQKVVQSKHLMYEFDVFGMLSRDHILSISKTRCQELEGRQFQSPNGTFANILKDWLAGGESSISKAQRLKEARAKTELTTDEVRVWICENIQPFQAVGELSSEQIDKTVEALSNPEKYGLYESLQNAPFRLSQQQQEE